MIGDAKSKMIDVSDDGEATADAGEFLVRSPGTSPGYWHGQTVHKISDDGFFSSGDLVRADEGHFTYVGRMKDLIVRGGSNISPIEVERALIVQPGIDDVAVIGLPDPNLGQRVAAAIVLASDADERAVLDAVEKAKAHLADYKLPERTIVVATIPRNNLSKVDRRAIEALFDRRDFHSMHN